MKTASKMIISIIILILFKNVLAFCNDITKSNNKKRILGIGINFVGTHQKGIGTPMSMGSGFECYFRYGTYSKLFFDLNIGYNTSTDEFLKKENFKSTFFPTISGKIGFCLNPTAILNIDMHGGVTNINWKSDISFDGLNFESDYYSDFGVNYGIGLRFNMNSGLKLHGSFDFLNIFTSKSNPKPKYTQYKLGLEYSLLKKMKKDKKEEYITPDQKEIRKLISDKSEKIEEKQSGKEIDIENVIPTENLLMNLKFHDRLGNKNGFLDPGERGRININFQNNSKEFVKSFTMGVNIKPEYYKDYLQVDPYPSFKVPSIPAMAKKRGELELNAKMELPEGEFSVSIFSNEQNISENIIIKAKVSRLDTIPPEIIITEPHWLVSRGIDVISVTNDTTINIRGFVKDKSPIKYILINADIPKLDKSDSKFNFSHDVPLTIGMNKIIIEAVDSYNNISEKSIKVTREISLEKKITFRGQRWAVVIGISGYKYSHKGIPNLRYADSDALSFYNYLRKYQGYPADHIRLLINEEATFMNVIDAMKSFLRQAIEEDLVIIYFAGHGAPELVNPNNLYLLCYDTDPERMPSTAYHMGDVESTFKRHIISKHVVFFADACHSGGIGSGGLLTTRSSTHKNLINYYLEKLKDAGEGRIVFTASDKDQQSQESEKWGGGHGVFTYYLVKGLQGEADEDGDRIVTAGEIFGYVSEKVRRDTYSQQTPRVPFGNFPWEFPLGYVK